MRTTHATFWIKRLSRLRRRALSQIAREVNSHMELPTAVNRRTRNGQSIWAVTMVRNEADIIELSVQHLLNQGVDGVLVADNLSTDDTLDRLRALQAGDRRVHIALDRLPAYYQAEKMTQLSRAAHAYGATFVLPFDADEFWFARSVTIAEFFRRTRLDLITAELHNAFPVRDLQVPLSRDEEFRVDLSVHPQGKVAFRSHPGVLVRTGNHSVVRPGEVGTGLYVVHVPWRSQAQLRRKTVDGAQAVLASSQQGVSWQWQYLAALREDEVADRWTRLLAGVGADDLGTWAPQGPFVLDRCLSWRRWPEHLGS